ncbi:MAG: hypothetical protein IBX50_12430 [Marinospirillum sp.]|uniref:hypothetical protein n=1 Tax=Marinospirillum sp. TaxID=2183934 RepID=UPI0019E7538E|nr:hypothetical protein [Marinospirillum sp.]MBE0507503.1 hypothetical protein [Marinospirillum sp.]
MNKIAQYNPSELAVLIDNTRKEAGGDFSDMYIRSLAGMLKRSPSMYLSFGPWWWVLKSEMINAGILDFGDETDAEVLEMLSYNNTDMNCAACYVAQSAAFDEYSTHTHDRTVVDLDGEPFVYRLADSTMEMMIAAQVIELGGRLQ